MPESLYIVRGTKDERAGVLFVMRDSDDRFDGDYRPVMQGSFVPGSRGTRFAAVDGGEYVVYGDWSAREIRTCHVCGGSKRANSPLGYVADCSACGARGWLPVD